MLAYGVAAAGAAVVSAPGVVADAAAAQAALSDKNRELNAFAMFWQLVKSWFAGLFGKGG